MPKDLGGEGIDFVENLNEFFKNLSDIDDVKRIFDFLNSQGKYYSELCGEIKKLIQENFESNKDMIKQMIRVMVLSLQDELKKVNTLQENYAYDASLIDSLEFEILSREELTKEYIIGSLEKLLLQKREEMETLIILYGRVLEVLN